MAKNLIIGLFLIYFMGFTFCRPSNSPDSDETSVEDNEYISDGNPEALDDGRVGNQNEPSKVGDNPNEENALRAHRILDFSANSYLERAAEERQARANHEEDNITGKQQYGSRDILDEKIDDALDASKGISQSINKRGMYNKYLSKQMLANLKEDAKLNHEAKKIALSNLRDNYFIPNHDPQTRFVKNSDGSNCNEMGTQLSENHQYDSRLKVDKSNEERAQPSEFDQITNELKRATKDLNMENSFNNYNRDRRNIKEQNEEQTEVNSSFHNEDEDNIKNEDEEMTIKRHIKRLSEQELDDLFKSLSESKKELLKKIIESENVDNDASLNKRDITKKAGAVEDNSLNENNQVENSKLQSEISEEISSGTTVTQKSNEKKEAIKQEEFQDVPEISTSKNADSSNSTPSSLGSKATSLTNEDSCKENDKMTSQIKKKRDIYDGIKEQAYETGDTFVDLDSNMHKGDQDYFCSQGQDFSNLMDYESQLHDEYNKKREATYNSNDLLSDSMKSLEESFPNANAYGDSAINMAPLVRVKRKNSDILIKKRAAALVPDAKISYFPYRAENDDEDNDEGNEFDDDGFYDRTSNLAKNIAEQHGDSNELNANSNQLIKSNLNREIKSRTVGPANFIKDRSQVNNVLSLGSDTDNILSGVEGMDDNLMFSSGSRSRRSSTYDLDSTGSASSAADKNDNHLQSLDGRRNYPIYQESDAYGPIQLNSEEGVSRYKRVRNANKDVNE